MNNESSNQGAAGTLSALPPEKQTAFLEALSILLPAMSPNNKDGPPDWVIDDKTIDEVRFTDLFLRKHPMFCMNDRIYDTDGIRSDDSVKKEISDMISPYIRIDVAIKVSKLLSLLKIRTHTDDLPPDTERIHFKNGIQK